MRSVLLFTLLLLTTAVYKSQAAQEDLFTNYTVLDYNYIDYSVYSWQLYHNIPYIFEQSANILSTNDIEKVGQEFEYSNQEKILFKSQIDRLDDILNTYKNDDRFIINTKQSIDILSEFRRGENGQDVLVPLGFFLYLNKKF